MEMALSTRGLHKRYGRQIAVDGLDMAVPRGAIYGFLGRNGAGKTTTMRMLLGLVRPDGGTIAMPGDGRRSTRIGALIEAPTIWDNLTGTENLDVTRRLLGAPRGDVDRVLAVVGLSAAAAARRAGGYSLGMRQRLGIARALIGRPGLLLLDEPTNGLDPDGIADVRHLLARLVAEEDMTVVVSSHLLDEVERVATHIGLVAAGKMVAEGAIADLRLGLVPVVEVDSDAGAAAALAAAGWTVTTMDSAPGRWRVETDAPERVAMVLAKAGMPIRRLVQHEGRLEHLFASSATRQEAA